MTNFKYLQKLFFLLVMGFSLSFICACGDDEEDETVQNPNEEIINPTDSIPSEDEPIIPNDSVADGGTIVVNGHEAVDLGLSVKWATCNVGADSPEEYGDYYAWGETETKSRYKADNSVTDGLSTSELKSRGIIAFYGNLTAAYDVATVKWGSGWRMPTKEELEELEEDCTWTWTTQNGVKGRRVTGPNGNSIFLPAAGSILGSWINYAGEDGYYWSSTPNESLAQEAYRLCFGSSHHFVDSSFRSYGRSVRPVSD